MSTPIDTQLREYSEFFDGLLDEVTIDDILTERVTSGPVQPLRPRVQTFRRRWVVAASAAVLVAVLIGGAALLLRATTEDSSPAVTPTPEQTVVTEPESSPNPTTAPEPTVLPEPETSPGPTVVPTPEVPAVAEDLSIELAASGTIDTELGTLRWSLLDAGQTALFDGFDLFETPSGLASWNPQTGGYWTSPDGVTWLSAPPPLPVVAESLVVRRAGDVYWIQTSNPVGLWRSNDFDSWTEIDLSGVAPPTSSGLDWTIQTWPVADSGSGSVLQWRARPELPLEEIFPEEAAIYPAIEAMGDFGLEEGVYAVGGYFPDTDTSEPITHIFVEAELGGGRVTSIETGELLHVFTWDVSPLQLPESPNPGVDVASPLRYSLDLLIVIDGDGRVTAVESPIDAVLPVVGSRGRFLAFTESGSTGESFDLEMWVSVDGLEWENRGTPAFLAQPADNAHVFENGGLLIADVIRSEQTERWVSTDGVTWERVPGHTGFRSDAVLPYGDGYVAWRERTLWVSADGDSWDRFWMPDLGLADLLGEFNGGIGGSLIVDKLFFRSYSDELGGINQFFVFELDSSESQS